MGWFILFLLICAVIVKLKPFATVLLLIYIACLESLLNLFCFLTKPIPNNFLGLMLMTVIAALVFISPLGLISTVQYKEERN